MKLDHTYPNQLSKVFLKSLELDYFTKMRTHMYDTHFIHCGQRECYAQLNTIVNILAYRIY